MFICHDILHNESKNETFLFEMQIIFFHSERKL